MGPGKSIGAVTQRRYAAPHFILTNSLHFLRVGLCSHFISSLQDTSPNKARRVKSPRLKRVDRVDPSPLDRH